VPSLLRGFLPEKGEWKAFSQTTFVLAESPRSLASFFPSSGLPSPKERVDVVDKSGNHIVRPDWLDAEEWLFAKRGVLRARFVLHVSLFL
jgi:hypothetical protein